MRVRVSIDFTLSNNTQLNRENLTWPVQINTQNINDTDIFRNTFTGFRAFQFSNIKTEKVTTLNSTFKLLPSKGYNGFISKQLSNSSNLFENLLMLPFNVVGDVPDYLFITFDEILNEYAPTFSISNNQNDKTVAYEYNKSSNVLVDLTPLQLQASDTLKLTLNIYSWSKPYASAKVTRISVNPITLYTENSLISFSCSENMFDAQMNISPGLCEQYADIKLYDRNGLIHKLAEKEQLTQNYSITVSAVDTDSTNYILGTYITDKWNIDSNTSEISVKCVDISKNFDKIKIPHAEIATRTLDTMLSLLFNFANQPWEYLNTETELYCKEFSTPNSWFREDTLDALLQNICKGGLLRIYWFVNRFIIARCW